MNNLTMMLKLLILDLPLSFPNMAYRKFLKNVAHQATLLPKFLQEKVMILNAIFLVSAQFYSIY